MVCDRGFDTAHCGMGFAVTLEMTDALGRCEGDVAFDPCVGVRSHGHLSACIAEALRPFRALAWQRMPTLTVVAR